MRILFFAPLLFLFTASAFARQTLLDSGTFADSPVEIHGFISQGFVQTMQNNYLAESKRGTTDFADAGLTLNKSLAPNLRAGFQLFARDFGRTGNYNAKFDWFLLDYHFRDWLGIRAGRVKIPYGLYNESNDIDSARAPILLPQSVYPSDQRDYLLAQTGFDLYGNVDLSSVGSLEYRLYRGTLQVDAGSTVGLPYQIQTSEVPYVQGGRLLWDTPVKGLRVGGSYQNLAYKSDLYIPSLSKTVATQLKVAMGVGSVEYQARNLLVAAEYARWWGEFDSNLPAVLVPVHVTHERYYGMVAYRATEWLHPGFYYSETYPNNRLRAEIKDYVKDSAAFCRVDLTNNWLIKGEVHFMDGTAGLSSSQNGGKAPNDMARHWEMFLVKTTIYF